MNWNNIWSWIGFCAALLTSTSFIPRLVLRLRKPAEAKIANGTLVTFMLGALLWMLYGFHLKDAIIIGANIFVFVTIASIAALQIFQKKSDA